MPNSVNTSRRSCWRLKMLITHSYDTPAPGSKATNFVRLHPIVREPRTSRMSDSKREPPGCSISWTPNASSLNRKTPTQPATLTAQAPQSFFIRHWQVVGHKGLRSRWEAETHEGHSF